MVSPAHEVRSVPTAISLGFVSLGWPMGSIQVEDGLVVIRRPSFGLGRRVVGRDVAIPAELRIEPTSIDRIARFGTLWQLGVVFARRGGALALWGPGVIGVLANLPGLPEVERLPRRPYSRTRLLPGGDPFFDR